MRRQFFFMCFVVAGLMLALSVTVRANDKKPLFISAPFGTVAVADTIPSAENTKPEQGTDNKPAEIIKEVPRSRKQLKPLAITTQAVIKPVIVKPKIIVKPIIKLH